MPISPTSPSPTGAARSADTTSFCRRVQGVDGIKTGYIRASGFNIVTSVRRDGRKLVVVVMGGDSARQRNDAVEALIERYLPQASRAGS